jgi:hypothetical protein
MKPWSYLARVFRISYTCEKCDEVVDAEHALDEALLGLVGEENVDSELERFTKVVRDEHDKTCQGPKVMVLVSDLQRE